MSFWGELRRRNVVKVAVAYAIVGWLLAQVTSVFVPALNLPAWVTTFVAFILVIGFPVALILSWAYELTPEGIKKTRHVLLEESVTHMTGQRLNYIVTALLALAVVFVVVDNYVLDDDAEVLDRQAVAAPTEAATDVTAPAEGRARRDVLPNSVAVLLCANFSTDPENDYFAASLHEELLNQLFKLRNLNVIARTSVLQYAEAARPITEIADELGVEAVMECSVAYGDGRIVISAQLIDGQTGVHLWSDRYNRAFEDVFGIQADIAMNVANAVGAQFSDEERVSIERRPTSSPVAYALYLQARSVLTGGNVASRTHALLDQALALDPKFALALGAKAGNYAGELVNTAGNTARDQAELEPLIREYAARALELDAQSPEALAALGLLAAFSWHWTEARESVLHALESRQVLLVGNVGNWFLSWSGSHEESVRFAEQAVTLSPLDWLGHWNLGMVLHYAGRYDEAAASLRRGIEMMPAQPVLHTWLAYTEVARGNSEAALEEMQLTEQLIPEREILYLTDLAYCYGRIGDSENAQRLYNEIEAIAAEQELGAGGRALASLAIGDYDEALRWLNIGADKASGHELDAGMFSLMNLKLNFTADPMLERPEFVDVRNRLRGD
jgi:TolB-like protein/tetratricopeptide (TPR) repeat protein